jgi:hypothetical protein
MQGLRLGKEDNLILQGDIIIDKDNVDEQRKRETSFVSLIVGTYHRTARLGKVVMTSSFFLF